MEQISNDSKMIKEILKFKNKHNIKYFLGKLNNGKILTIDNDYLYILNQNNNKIQNKIKINNSIKDMIQMKNGLLILVYNKETTIKVIKLLSFESYEIFLNLKIKKGSENYSYQLQESPDENLIIGNSDIQGYIDYYLFIFKFINEKYHLTLKLRFDKLVIKEPKILFLENKKILICMNKKIIQAEP